MLAQSLPHRSLLAVDHGPAPGADGAVRTMPAQVWPAGQLEPFKRHRQSRQSWSSPFRPYPDPRPPVAGSAPSDGLHMFELRPGAAPAADSAPTASEALVDGPPLQSMLEGDKRTRKPSRRRASEGSARISKPDRRHASELKCDECGKPYKHPSCLAKHRWEHKPEWKMTSKFLYSKHQQVQLLEAATALMSLREDGSVGDAAESLADQAVLSPGVSGSSEHDGDLMGSPPRRLADEPEAWLPYAGRPHSDSVHSSSAYSQSYQSTVFSDNGYPGYVHRGSVLDNRPATSGTSVAGSYPGDAEKEQADVAAAAHMLCGSYPTPPSRSSGLPSDVPPVPPLPPQYCEAGVHPARPDVLAPWSSPRPPDGPSAPSQPSALVSLLDRLAAEQLAGATTVTAQQSSVRGNPERRYHGSLDTPTQLPFGREHGSDDVRMADDGDLDGQRPLYQARIDDDDDGIFGRMEE